MNGNSLARGRVLRAAIYLRISSDRSGEEYGVDRQREDAVALVAARSWDCVGVYVDNDVSATSGRVRPQWEALMAVLDAGELDVVVGWTIDRVLRSGKDRLRMLDAGRKHGITISIVRGSDMDLSTPSGRLAADILGAVALNEVEAKSDRQRRAVEQAAMQGRWVGGRRAFGYAADGRTILPAEAAVVRSGYEALLSGVSLRGIANEWNSAGFTTAQRPWKHAHLGEHTPWRADSVRRVLTNARNAGIRTLRGDEYGPAEWKGLVPEETYRAAVALLTDPTRRLGGAGMAGRQFLTGLALCGLDGCGLWVHGGGAKHKKPVYRCRSAALLVGERPTVPGTHVNRLAAPVDDWVSRLVVERLARPDARELLIDHRRPNVPALRDEANALRARLEGMAAEFGADPDTSAAEYRAMRSPVRARVAEIEAEIADAGRLDLLGPLVVVRDVAAAWDELPLDRRRAVVDVLMEVRLHAIGRGTRTFRLETVEIMWKG